MNILIAVVVFLIIASMVQLVRVGELISQIKNQDTNKVTEKDNKTQSLLFFIIGGVIYLALVLWQFKYWGIHILPPASSVHGEVIDGLMNFTLGLIILVFFITQPLLVWFVFKYRKAEGNETAFYYPHNNKLELIWTVVPTIVLTAVILYGLNVWNQITGPPDEEATIIEVYSKQFSWTARYAGKDNQLGDADFRLVAGDNELGVISNTTKEYLISEYLPTKISELEKKINNSSKFSEKKKITEKLKKAKKQKERIINYLSDNPKSSEKLLSAEDDIVTNTVHLVVDKPVLLKFRSQDVIHSAYLPHFRVQMNCVPGMVTQFAFTPTQTTKEMKEQEGEDFEFILLCNKICGIAHYNMQMKFIVETQAEYDKWMKEQETLSQKLLTQN
jgi:cytochrome c oxidase subunit 2